MIFKVEIVLHVAFENHSMKFDVCVHLTIFCKHPNLSVASNCVRMPVDHDLPLLF